MARLSLDITNFETNLKRAQEEMRKASKSATQSASAFDSINKVGDGMQDVGKNLTSGITVPLLGVATASVKVASDFEAGMSRVQALSDSSKDQMEALRKKALQMGKDTKFSAGESAEAFQYMASAGWDSQEMIDGISGVMALASADNLDLATTTDIVTNSLTAFGKTAKDTNHFADVLAKTSSGATTDVRTLGESFKYVAPLAGAVGYSVEDVSLALGLMSNAGIKGSQAGTSLRSAFANLYKPTDAMAVAMKRYGIKMTDANGQIKPMRVTLEELRTKFAKMTKSQQVSTSATLFGKEAMSGMLAIITASPKKYDELKNSIDNADGSADKMAKTLQDNLNGDIEALKGSVETMGIAIGTVMIPYMRKATKVTTDLANAMLELNEEQIQSIIKWGLILASIGPIISIIGTLVSFLGSFAGMVTTISTFLVGAGGLIPAIASLGTVMAVAISVIGILAGVGYSLVASFGGVNGTVKMLQGTFEEIKAKVMELAKTWKLDEKFDMLKQSVIGLLAKLGNMKDFWTVIITVLKVVAEIVAGTVMVVFWAFSDMLGSVIKVIGGFVTMLSGLGTVLVGVFTGDFGKAYEGVMTIGEGIKEAFGGMISWVINGVRGFVSTIIGFFYTLWDVLVGHSIVPDLCKAIVKLFGNMITWVVNHVKAFINNVITFFVTLYTKVTQTIKNLFNGIYTVVSSVISRVKTTVSSGFGSVASTIKSKVDTAVTNVKTGFTNMVNSISSKLTSAKGTIKTKVLDAFKILKELPAKAVQWGEDIVLGLIKGIKAKAKELTDNIANLASEISGYIGFSVPEKGALTDFETYMPDMIDGLSQTLLKASPKLYKSLKGVTQNIKDRLQITPDLMGALAGANVNATGVNKSVPVDRTNTYNSNTPTNITIENITVRSDADIDKISKGLYQKDTKSIRALGKRG